MIHFDNMFSSCLCPISYLGQRQEVIFTAEMREILYESMGI